MNDLSNLSIGKHSISILTGRLRWRKGLDTLTPVLEQEMSYQDYDAGKCVSQHNEWQQVPEVESDKL